MEILEAETFRLQWQALHPTAFESEYSSVLEGGPTRRKGPEIEIPLVDVRRRSDKGYGKAISAARTKKLLEKICEVKGSSWKGTDDPLRIEGSINGKAANITTDCGAAVLEAQLPPTGSLLDMERAVKALYRTITSAAGEIGAAPLGYGIQPFTAPSSKLFASNPRYRAMAEALTNPLDPASERFLHSMALTASLQIHFELGFTEQPEMFRVFNNITPALIALSANSSVVEGKDSGYLSYREAIWDKVGEKDGYEERTGISPEFKNAEQFYEVLFSKNLIITHRNGTSYAFSDRLNMNEFLRIGEATALNLNTGEKTTLRPSIEDYESLMGSIWWAIRPTRFGTGEVRPMCNQPDWQSTMAGIALVSGIADNRAEALEYFGHYSRAQVKLGRLGAMRWGVNGMFGRRPKQMPLDTYCRDVLEVAENGLRLSGQNTRYLDPFKEILESRTTTAEISNRVVSKGKEAFIDCFRLKAT